MAAYPVLIPLYLAQFTVNDVVDDVVQEVSITSIMDAGFGEVSLLSGFARLSEAEPARHYPGQNHH